MTEKMAVKKNKTKAKATAKKPKAKSKSKKVQKSAKTILEISVRILLDTCIGTISSEDEKKLYAFLGKKRDGYVSLQDPTAIPLSVVDLLLENHYDLTNALRVSFQKYRNNIPFTDTAEQVAVRIVHNPREFYDSFGRFIIVSNQKFLEQANRQGYANDRDRYDEDEDALVGPAQVEYQLNGRWYPVSITPQFGRGMMGPYVYIKAKINICDSSEDKAWMITVRDFPTESTTEKTVEMLLNRHGLRLAKPDSSTKHMERLLRAQELSKQYGVVMNATNKAVRLSHFFFSSSSARSKFGSESVPRRVIVETELEATQITNYTNGNTLPFIRCFSTEMKEYVYMDVDDLKPYVFDETAINRLVVPDSMDKILRPVFEAGVTNLFGDLVKGKHGGMVILAEGSPGVGKTMTAEVFAEHSKRPLYTMEVGELGISIDQIEANLRRIFHRASRWNAVLLLDEADIFMTERGDDLERSAIVGVFLRLLDYYPGLLFLTTNRNQAIDPAFKSRVTLKLSYQKLTTPTREKIWKMMFESAGLSLVGDNSRWENFTNEELNGRQIRNVVRLLRVMNPTGEVTSQSVTDILGFVAR